MYLPAYLDLELALANGEDHLQLGEPPTDYNAPGPFNPTLTLPAGEGERPPDQWVTSQADIYPGDAPRGPYGQVPEGFGWPSAVPIRPGRWDLDTNSYRIASGDTIAGLATTYLGSPSRLMELWLFQPATFRAGRSADKIFPDEWLAMPPDAVATLYAAVGLPVSETGGTPAEKPPGGYVVTGSIEGTDVEKAKQADRNKKIAIVAAAVVGGGALLWALS